MSNPQRSGISAHATGATVIRDAKESIDGAIADVGARGKAALRNVRDVRDTFADALLDSIEQHPYTTLALVGGVGFIFGAAWRR